MKGSKAAAEKAGRWGQRDNGDGCLAASLASPFRFGQRGRCPSRFHLSFAASGCRHSSRVRRFAPKRYSSWFPFQKKRTEKTQIRPRCFRHQTYRRERRPRSRLLSARSTKKDYNFSPFHFLPKFLCWRISKPQRQLQNFSLLSLLGGSELGRLGESLKRPPKLPVSKQRKQSVLVCHLKGFATGPDGFEIGIPFTIWVNGISCHV